MATLPELVRQRLRQQQATVEERRSEAEMAALNNQVELLFFKSWVRSMLQETEDCDVPAEAIQVRQWAHGPLEWSYEASLADLVPGAPAAPRVVVVCKNFYHPTPGGYVHGEFHGPGYAPTAVGDYRSTASSEHFTSFLDALVDATDGALRSAARYFSYPYPPLPASKQ